jgi:hypothetical protein
MTTATLQNPPTVTNTEDSMTSPKPTICNLHIALAETGRVGKSTTIKHLAEYLSMKGEDFQIADTDRQNPDVAEGYTPELLASWRNFGANSSNQFAPKKVGEDNSIESLLQEQIYFSDNASMAYMSRRLMKLTKLTPNLLVNIPANSYPAVIDFLKTNSVGTKPNSKVQLFNWWVSDGSHKSLNLFLETKLMFPEAHHILVLNQGRSDIINDFGKYHWPSSLLDKYQDPKYATSQIKTVPMPELLIDPQIWYDKDGMSHTQILTDPEVDEFDTGAIEIWQAKVFEAIKKTGLI